jgi:hypothetical protein
MFIEPSTWKHLSMQVLLLLRLPLATYFDKTDKHNTRFVSNIRQISSPATGRAS